jgi:hypothetical protein
MIDFKKKPVPRLAAFPASSSCCCLSKKVSLDSNVLKISMGYIKINK